MEIGPWYCVITNCMCILPCVSLYKRELYGDCILYGSTGVVSFIYHMNKLITNFLNDTGIRNSDIILANLSVFHTVHILYFYDNALRWNYTMAWLPIVIYTSECGLDVRFGIMIAYGLTIIMYIFVQNYKYSLEWIIFGTLSIISELICFSFANKLHYVWLHGTHHILSFLSLYLFLKGIRPHEFITS